MSTTTVTCACGAVYERTEHKASMRDHDSFDCQKCGKQIESWNGSRYPTFHLIKEPDTGGNDVGNG